MRNVVFKILYYKEHARNQINNGVPAKNFLNDKDTYYEDGLLDIHRVESVTAAVNFKNHICLMMYSGDIWTVRLRLRDYFRLIDHIAADKLICKLNN